MGIGLVIDVTQELPKNKYGAGVTVVKIAASDKPGQDLRSHFPVRNITNFAKFKFHFGEKIYGFN